MATECWLFLQADYHILSKEGSVWSIEIKKAFEVVKQKLVIPLSKQTLLKTVSFSRLDHVRRLLGLYEIKQSHQQYSIAAQTLGWLLCIDDSLLLGP